MTPRFAICIPVYDNPKTIVGVIDDCLAQYEHPVIVVDDGSKISVLQLYTEAHPDFMPQAGARLQFARHPQNRGKGVALQTAFKLAIQSAYTHLITIDGDGQHMAEDVAKLVQAARLNPWALIIGDREMKQEQAPKSSLFGKKFSNFWVRYQTESSVADSQSGFRIYPLFFVQNMKFFCKKYDFEIEVLIRLIWRGVQIQNVSISVEYFMGGGRVTHFHKWKDNYRISVLNTFLTIGSLLREQTSPLKSAMAMGLGVFIGTLPVYGLHTGIAAALAFACRLNFVYLWIGTNISIPPLVPLLVFASDRIGAAVIGASEPGLAGMSKNWLIGSVILGLALGVIAFALTFFIKRRMNRKQAQGEKRAWTGQNKNKTGIAIVRFVMQLLGLRGAYALLYFIVFYYYLFSFRSRHSLSEFWKTVEPGIGFFRRQIKIYQQILIFAKTLVDRGMQRQNSELCFDYEVDDKMKEFFHHLQNKPEGVVAVSSHFGGWEIAMTFFARRPTHKKILAVMHGIPQQYGHSSGVQGTGRAEPVYFNLAEHTILKIKDSLAQGNIVGMMGDRPVSSSCELVPFFGKLALFDSTPFRVAAACKAQIFILFSVKTGRKQYNVYAFSPPQIRPDGRAATANELLDFYVAHLEKVVRKNPEQWFNFFPFWSEVSNHGGAPATPDKGN